MREALSRLRGWPTVFGGAILVAGLWTGSRLIRGPEVAVTKATRRELVQTIVASGRVMPPARMHLGSVLLGTVAEVLVDEGETVQRGQLLLRLEDKALHAAVEQARAALAQTRARLDQLRRFGVQAAAEELKQAELAQNQAQSNYERIHELYQSGSGSKSQLEEAETTLALARSRWQRALLQATNTSQGGAEFAIASAAVSQAEAGLAAANAQLAQSLLSAPADGVVLAREVEPGDVVQPGKALLVLARSGPVHVTVPFDEKNLSVLQAGQQALVSAEAFPEKRFPAQVEQLAPAVDPQRGTIEARLLVPEPPEYLRPEMTVSVELEVARRKDALVVAREALRATNSEQPSVLVVRNGRVERRDVRVGTQGEDLVELLSGVEPGELVVIDTSLRLDPGMPARPIERE